MNIPYLLRSEALRMPYTNKGKGGVFIEPEKLISNFNPVKLNGSLRLAKEHEARNINHKFNLN